MASRRRRALRNQRITTSVPITACSEEEDEINEEDYFTDTEEEEEPVPARRSRAVHAAPSTSNNPAIRSATPRPSSASTWGLGTSTRSTPRRPRESTSSSRSVSPIIRVPPQREEPQIAPPKKRAPLVTKTYEDPDNIRLAWEHPDIEYDENEDLLTFKLPRKPKDVSARKKGFRLMIGHILVHNFKSYRGEHMLGPFHKNLTMILGPNGSGKSNVIDALLFVFGFRSNKIRTKKMSSLIHTAASMGGQRCDSCRVEIFMHFIKDDGKDHYKIKSDSNISVSRTVFADNTSKYTICGRNASYKEVEQYFTRVGIDLTHNRFLILQGEVEAIAMMKPRATAPGEEGMLEYVEDIVGSNRFVPWIRKLEHRVRLYEIQSSQQSLYVREAEKNKKEMEPDVRHAQRFINARNEATLLRSRLYQVERYQHIENKKPIEAEVRDREVEISEAEDKKKDIVRQIRDIEDADRENTVKINTCHEEIEGLTNQIRERDQDELKRKTKLKNCNQQLVQMDKDMDELKKQKLELEQNPERAATRIQSLTEESSELQIKASRDSKTADANTVKFEKKAAADKKNKAAAEEEWSTKNAVLNELRTRAMVLESDIADMRKSSKRDQASLEEQKRQYAVLEKKYESDTLEMVNYNMNIAEPQRLLLEAQSQLPQLVREEAEMKVEKTELEARQAAADRHYHKNFRGKKAHQALMHARETGVLKGLIGRLGDLATIDPIYDAAISTVMAQLEWYVVDTTENGQACIDWLIANSLPRKSFLCLDQGLKTNQIKDKPGTRYPAKRLYDQIHFTDTVIQAVYYQYIPDLLVVDTLVEAQTIDRVYKGKYRVVTIAGELIEKSGSVSGGGNPLRGRMNLGLPGDQAAEQVNQHQANYYRLTAELAEMEKNYKAVSERLALVRRQHEENGKITNDMISRNHQIKSTIDDDKRNLDKKKMAIEAQELRMKAAAYDPEDLEKKEAELERIRNERDEAEVAANLARENVQRIDQRIEGIMQELVYKHRNSANVAEQRRADVEQEIAKEKASIINSEHRLIEVNAEIAEKSVDQMRKNIEYEALARAEQDHKEDITVQPLLTNRTAKLQILQEHEQTFRKKRNELDVEERAVSAQISNLRDVVHTLQQQIDSYEFELENLDRNLKLLKIEKVPDFRDFENLQVKTKVGWICYDENGEEEKDDDEDDDDEDDDKNAARRNTRGLFEDVVEMTTLTDEQIQNMPRAEKDKMVLELKALNKFMDTNRQNTDKSIFDEYLARAKVYAQHVAKMEHYGKRLTAHRKRLHQLRTLRYNEFSDALAFLGATTQDLYQLITNGGNASLKFVEEGRSDPFDAGVKFSVRPAKKSWKLIENLSGGEKTLASLCFVFAMHHYRATPLYVMDEIDAALDTQNVLLIANYIKNSPRTRNAQFIIISLRNQMFEMANRLIGVHKTEDCTHHVVVAPDTVSHLTNTVFDKLVKKLKERARVNVVEEVEEEEMPAADDQQTAEVTQNLQNITINNGNGVRQRAQKKTPKLRVLRAPRIEDLEPEPVRPRGVLMKKAQEAVAPPIQYEDFDFEQDEAPVIKRRRRTVVHDEDEDDDDDVVAQEDQEDRESENNDATTSAAEALIDFSSASTSTSRSRASRSTRK